MKKIAAIVFVLLAVACTDKPRASGDAVPSARIPRTSPSPSAQADESAPSRAADIYAAVLGQLRSERNLARSEVIFVVDGAVAGAGHPDQDPFGPAPHEFGEDVVASIRQQASGESPPLRFVHDGKSVLLDPTRPGRVKNGGVLISLGPMDTKTSRVRVPSTLWCGGKCSRWQTYELSQRKGSWVVTGTTGAVVSS